MWEIVEALAALVIALGLSLLAVWMLYAIITILSWIVSIFK